MRRDARHKIQSCIIQILQKRESHGLQAKQIAKRLETFGFMLDGYKVRAILQDMWLQGVIIKQQDERGWRPLLRYKLVTRQEIPVMLEIVESPYNS